MAQPNNDSPKSSWKRALNTAIAALFVSILALGTSIWQGYISRNAMQADERAWIMIPIPSSFPLDGSTIPVNLQITDSGKTPARITGGAYVATVLRKGEKPSIGNFSLGHAYNKFATGAVYPQAPIPMLINLQIYGDKSQQVVTVDDQLRKDIADGNRYIILYGRISYTDIFAVPHWTQFCTGSGPAIDSDSLHDCVLYNDFDSNEE